MVVPLDARPVAAVLANGEARQSDDVGGRERGRKALVVGAGVVEPVHARDDENVGRTDDGRVENPPVGGRQQGVGCDGRAPAQAIGRGGEGDARAGVVPEKPVAGGEALDDGGTGAAEEEAAGDGGLLSWSVAAERGGG